MVIGHQKPLYEMNRETPFAKGGEEGVEFSGLQNLLLCCIVLWFRYC